MKKCERCGKDKLNNKKLCNSCTITVFRQRRKFNLVEYKGGKCEICGYNKCLDSLHFHHLDKKEKDFGISEKGTTRSWEIHKSEVDKCILVCANCHHEIHFNNKIEYDKRLVL